MKTRLLLFFWILTMTVFGKNTIPNGDFENWKSRNFEYPEFYNFNSNLDDHADTTFNLTKTTTAYSGNYALKMVTVGSTTNGVKFGYAVDGNVGEGNPEQWTGGIPCAEKPTGIQGFYKYNVTAGDTALIIVKFKKSGAQIGIYFFKLYGKHDAYTPFDFNFNLSETPDSMIIGFASSYAITDTGLPGSELYIDNVSLKGVSAQPSQLNGDFESWKSGGFESIENWNVSSNQDENSCKKTTDAAKGVYAVELTSYQGDENNIPVARPTQLSTGYYDDNSNGMKGGIPFTDVKGTLAFYYKYAPADPSGKAEVSLQFKKNGQVFGYFPVELSATGSYQLAELPFDLSYMGTPDTVLISILSGRWSDTGLSHVGSVLKIDSMYFKSSGSGGPDGSSEIVNGGFENWNSISYEYPENYPYNSNADNAARNISETNLYRTNDAYQSSNAVKLVTTGSGDNIQFGYFLNGNPGNGDPTNWKGGIPISEKPTGIKGYFKYNVASGDTALVVVMFSKAGEKIGAYFLPLSGLHTTYTPFEFTFSPALTETPDSIILGFASSWAIAEKGQSGSELYVDQVSLTGIATQPAQLNGNFEYWSSQTKESPENWNVQNENSDACRKTNDAAIGNFAIELHTTLVNEDGKMKSRPGLISKGQWSDQSGRWEGGMPYNSNQNKLSFYYKYAPAQPTDSAQIWMSFRNNGLEFAFQNIYLPASQEYKYMEVSIDQNFMFQPNEVVIGIMSNLWTDTLTTHAGSILKVDEIKFVEDNGNGNGGSNPGVTPVEAAYVPNGNFELWDSYSYDYPTLFPYNSNNDEYRGKTKTIRLFKSSDAHHGTSAVKLITTLPLEGNNFGYLLNGNPNSDSPTQWTGGIPIQEKPTGIKGYFKYNVASGDTAMVFVTFSKSGKNIGFYSAPLFGLHTTYTEFNLPFSLAEVPDSMIVAFASSWSKTNIGKPGSELLVDDISLTGVNAQPAQLDGDFELWTSKTVDIPTSWSLQNNRNESGLKTYDSAEGSNALELRTLLKNEDGVSRAIPMMISTGYWNDNRGMWSGGFPFNNAVDTLAFYYKYIPAQPTDSALVSILCISHNMPFYYEETFLTASQNYQYKEMPFMIFNEQYRADSAIITVQSGLWSDSLAVHAGSILKIDGIHLKSAGSPTPVFKTEKEDGTSLYPNPTNGIFRIRSMGEDVRQLEIFSVSGQKVLSYGKDLIQGNMEIDMTTYPRGVYLIRIHEGNKTEMKKLILK